MSLSKVSLKYKTNDIKLNVVLEDYKRAINNLIDEINASSSADELVQIGSGGQIDYLSPNYFTYSNSEHIYIKNYYSTSAPLSGGGTLAANRTLALLYYSTDLGIDGSNQLYVKDAGIDHGGVGGLADDDHTQYSLVGGSRAFTGVVGGITPTADAHLSTKKYIDDAVAGSSLYAFKTITGITNDVVADAIGDTLTLASANTRLTIVGTTATDIITFTVVEANIDHDALTNFVADEHFLQTAITNVSTALSTGLLKVTTGTGALSVITDASSNWNTAYGWGDHSDLHSPTYLTATAESALSGEIDLGSLATGLLKGTVAAGISTISAVTDSSANWNTAYGWGNHASAGYLTSVTAHQLDTAIYHTVSGLTAGHFLKATGATTFGFAVHGLTYSDVGALASGGTAADSDKWDGVQFSDYLDQAIKQASSPIFTTVKLSGLTDGYLPVHVSDAVGLTNSPIYTTGANVYINASVGIGTPTPVALLNAPGVATFGVGGQGAIGVTLGSSAITEAQSSVFNIQGFGPENAWFGFGMFYSGSQWIPGATSAFQLYHSGTSLRIYGDSSLTPGTAYTPTERISITASGNFGMGTPDQFGGGVKVIGIVNAGTVPASNPTGGGVLYCEAGALKYRGSSGTVTQLGAA